MVKNIKKWKSFFVCTSAVATMISCKISFTNSTTVVPQDFRKVYVPAATDESTIGGNSGRISYVLRKHLSENTRFILVGADEARWGLDLRIISRNGNIMTLEKCVNTDNLSSNVEKIGSDAFWCKNSGIFQPSTASGTESISYRLDLVATDLVTGRNLKRTTIDIMPGLVIYPMVSNDGRIKSDLTSTPELHALRYVENRDASINNIAEYIAN